MLREGHPTGRRRSQPAGRPPRHPAEYPLQGQMQAGQQEDKGDPDDIPDPGGFRGALTPEPGRTGPWNLHSAAPRWSRCKGEGRGREGGQAGTDRRGQQRPGQSWVWRAFGVGDAGEMTPELAEPSRALKQECGPDEAPTLADMENQLEHARREPWSPQRPAAGRVFHLTRTPSP